MPGLVLLLLLLLLLQVAIKVTRLSAEQLSQPGVLRVRTAAELEAMLMEKLEHPNVVKTLACLRRHTRGGGWEQRLVQVGHTPSYLQARGLGGSLGCLRGGVWATMHCHPHTA